MLQVSEEQEEQLAQLRSELAERLLRNRQRLEDEQATLMEAQAQVCSLCYGAYTSCPSPHNTFSRLEKHMVGRDALMCEANIVLSMYNL